MDARRLLRRLRDAGFRIGADGDDVLVVPQSNLTLAIVSRIEKRKAGLLDLLNRPVHRAPNGRAECVDCGEILLLSGVRCPSCRDAHPKPTCASCGAETDGPDLSVCDLCRVEQRVLEMQEPERRVA